MVGSRRELCPCVQRTRFRENTVRTRNRPLVRLKIALHYGEQVQVKPRSTGNDENRHKYRILYAVISVIILQRSLGSVEIHHYYWF